MQRIHDASTQIPGAWNRKPTQEHGHQNSKHTATLQHNKTETKWDTRKRRQSTCHY